jgi:hypothetical protein
MCNKEPYPNDLIKVKVVSRNGGGGNTGGNCLASVPVHRPYHAALAYLVSTLAQPSELMVSLHQVVSTQVA